MNQKVIVGIGIGLIVVAIGVFVSKRQPPEPVEAQDAVSLQAKEIYRKAKDLKKDRDLLEARELYKQLVQEHPDMDEISTVQQDLEKINMDLILSMSEVPGKTAVHEVVSGDTLGKIAKKYNTTVELTKHSNNLKSDVIRLGQKIRVWTAPFNIFVDKSQNILILKSGNEVMKVYNVSTGENNSTPIGTFTITSKLVDPVWFNKGVVVPPDSPANVLGTRWLGFDIPGYGIHGTTEPDRIGEQVTAGCVRMRNEEVEELYSIVPVGTTVEVVD